MSRRATDKPIIEHGLRTKLDKRERKVKSLLKDSIKTLDILTLSDEFKRLMSAADISAKSGYSMTSICSLEDGELQELAEAKSHTTFECKFKDEDIRKLLPVVNEKIFAEPQTVKSVKQWMACEQQFPVRVANGKKLAYLMRLLCAGKYICSNWQKVADDNKVFVFAKSGKIISAKYLSKTLSQGRKGSQTSLGECFDKDLKNAVDSL